jgi:hypothetical protein
MSIIAEVQFFPNLRKKRLSFLGSCIKTWTFVIVVNKYGVGLRVERKNLLRFPAVNNFMQRNYTCLK